jgi:hypothetical protein
MKSKAKILVALAAIVLLGLAACAGLQPASSSAVEDLTGVWYIARFDTYLQINEDGSFGFADSQQELESAPFDAGQYRLEGTTLTFMTDDESEYCSGATGSYEITVTEESQIEFTHKEYPCWERRMGLMAEPWVWVEP